MDPVPECVQTKGPQKSNTIIKLSTSYAANTLTTMWPRGVILKQASRTLQKLVKYCIVCYEVSTRSRVPSCLNFVSLRSKTCRVLSQGNLEILSLNYKSLLYVIIFSGCMFNAITSEIRRFLSNFWQLGRGQWWKLLLQLPTLMYYIEARQSPFIRVIDSSPDWDGVELTLIEHS